MAADLTIQAEVPPSRIAELTDLMRTAWWMSDRTPAEVARLVEHSDIVITLTLADRVVGFARVLTDYTHIALVLDVIVDE
jgi:hypothetical protein